MNNTTSIKPDTILANCTLLNPLDDAYINHPIIQHFGSPLQPIYVDQCHVDINGVSYDNPLILPVYDGQLELVQCAVLHDKQQIQVIPDGLAKGFAMFGELHQDKPFIITYSLEAFFKIAQTGYAVALVVLPSLCDAHHTEFKSFDFEQMQFVINQLSKSGYDRLYIPVRPEHIQLEAFQNLEKNSPVRLLNQFQKAGESDFLTELLQDDDVEEVRAFLDYAIEQLPPLNQWGELLPLVQADTALNSPYPIHALPPLARDAVIAIAEHVQAPIAMTAQCVIGAMSHIAQAHVNAPHPFSPHGEPCSLYLLTEGQSGSRKSTSRNMADKAIIQHERKQYEQYRRDLEQWKSGQASLNKKDKEVYCAENPPPHDPSTLYSDITLESIAGLYVDGVLNNASIASDEAGQFFGGYTMKGDTRTQAIGGYAKLFDDGFVERTRSKSNLNGSGRAYDVRLTFNLQGQHEVLSDALKDPVLRGQGFLPRFILTIPENLAGTRLQDAIYRSKNANHDHRLIAYWTRCEYLLDDCPRPQGGQELHNGRYVIPMNDEAKEIDASFYNMFEELQGKGKRYEYLQAFASRASQLARRLATVFAYFEGIQWIDAKTLTGACEVVKHSLNEWAMYADIEVKAESDAERLIKWLVRKCVEQKTSSLSKTLAMKGAPSHLRKAKEFDPCINELIEFNYVRLVTINKSTYIELNPLLLK
ncbi:DUF3987 domain-containing protein [Acinetobacter baumannii]|uniref:DUF3987 domain-containing protein n=1 Tax=Acinetobacter baumannii TaxID=470 RepID=UPI0024DE28A9|nr:DUF3987 domain-containing protein [Acinetobacter baumannii]MDK2108355.1 DUF3987 domain-containing protein [Acinetobacter baumannii]MDK2113698.1 DUF3987 domain-containing protein [Acinetobacter baumannii]MDK2143209.1 DUF3987 domain-containing protein [Acinetobacter baumannii]MDK2154079.1 DUF3987 domain-containing protein [Acinetobacter baumannii]MDK2157838.1 DUF3987 domain-containing protein [Acinetobacter baumannii]